MTWVSEWSPGAADDDVLAMSLGGQIARTYGFLDAACGCRNFRTISLWGSYSVIENA